MADEGGLPASETVGLQRATPEMAPMLSNLLELYVHDLSESFLSRSGLTVASGTRHCRSIRAEPACVTHF